MSGVERRHVLQWAATAGAATVGGPALAAPATPAAAAGPASPVAPTAGVHEQVARDAAITWTEQPGDAAGAPVLGNGHTVVRLTGSPRALLLAISTPTGAGELEVSLEGSVTGVRWTLDVWNAELTGTVTTTRGVVELVAYVHHGSGTLVARFTERGSERVRCRAVPGTNTGTGVAWREVAQSRGRRLLLAGTNHTPGPVAAHRRWWHDFHSRSFVQVPHRAAQRMLVAQLYLAAATQRRDAAGGATAPEVLAAAGRLHIHPAATVAGGGWPHGMEHLMTGLPGTGLKNGHTPGPVLAWNLPELWRYHEYTGDAEALDALRPMLRSAAGFYADFLVEGDDGRLHLPTSYSPEYGDAVDATYHLAQLRWALDRLIRTAGPGRDPVQRWRDLAARLTPYPQDRYGVQVGAGLPLARSHPHPSHLLWLHPLGGGTPGAGPDRDLARRSLDHWSAHQESWTAASHADAARLEVALRNPARALAALDAALRASTALTAPTPAAATVTGLLVGTGDDGALEVLSAVPPAWTDVSFGGLRLTGGHSVDAERRGGHTTLVRLRHATGGTVVVRHGITGPVEARAGGRPLPSRSPGDGSTTVTLRAGETVELAAPTRDAH